VERALSFIYLTSHPVPLAFYPPSLCSKHIGQATLDMTTVYMNLQPPDGTAWRSPASW